MSDVNIFLRSLADVLADTVEESFRDEEQELSGMAIDQLLYELKNALAARF